MQQSSKFWYKIIFSFQTIVKSYCNLLSTSDLSVACSRINGCSIGYSLGGDFTLTFLFCHLFSHTVLTYFASTPHGGKIATKGCHFSNFIPLVLLNTVPGNSKMDINGSLHTLNRWGPRCAINHNCDFINWLNSGMFFYFERLEHNIICVYISVSTSQKSTLII